MQGSGSGDPGAIIEPMNRVLRILSVAMITTGVVFLTDAGLTLAWKEPLSAVYSSLRQNAAASELDSVRRDFLERPEVSAVGGGGDDAGGPDPERRAKRLAALFAEDMEPGEAIGEIEIPAIDAGYVVLEGTATADLQRGPGHYPDTALPGEGKTIGIAGHRTTYGAPFKRIDDVDEGDEIILEMPYATLTYEVTETRIVEPEQVEIVDDVGRERLVLTACHPLYSAAQRYAVFADLSSVELLSSASAS